MTSIALLKYEALGNDFLVALEPAAVAAFAARGCGDGTGEPASASVAAVCDRRLGVGADGLITVRPAGVADGEALDVVMELRNADGRRAETSGNGLRCLALALLDEGVLPGPNVRVATDAGRRVVSLLERLESAGAVLKAGMGRLSVGEPEAAPGFGADWHARRVQAGNPHLVLVGPSLDGVDITEIGPPLERAVAGGQNVEAVAPDGAGGLYLVVWERGAGATQACGSGSCAAAAAALASGLVGKRVEVHNPGGRLVVDLEGPDPRLPDAYLTGPARRVCRVELPVSASGALV